ncbi:MAG: DUF6444 domain-containing protein [bacterium]
MGKSEKYNPTFLRWETLEQLSKEQLIERILLLQEQNVRLTRRMEELERCLGMNSQNSSKPPSSDPPHVERPKKKSTGRKIGGQPGHEGHLRQLLPVEEVKEVIPVKPSVCKNCNREIDGEDPSPRRHQVWELPIIRPEVIEYQLHTLRCKHCGECTEAELPQGVPRGFFGPRLQAHC